MPGKPSPSCVTPTALRMGSETVICLTGHAFLEKTPVLSEHLMASADLPDYILWSRVPLWVSDLKTRLLCPLLDASSMWHQGSSWGRPTACCWWACAPDAPAGCVRDCQPHVHRVPRAEDQCRCPSLVGGAELLLRHIGQHWLAPDCCCGVHLCHTAAGKDPKKGSKSASSRAGPGGLRSILGSVPVVQP